MTLNKTGIMLVAPVALILGACSTNHSPNSYDSRAVGQVNRVERGTIESYRWVQIERRSSGIGTVAGAGIGAAAGSTVGSGRGRGAENVIGAIGGALLGGLIGNSIDKAGSKRGGFEYLIRTNSGALVSIVQQDTSPLPDGAPVVIMFSGSQSRVVFDHNATQYQNNGQPNANIPPNQVPSGQMQQGQSPSGQMPVDPTKGS